MSNKEIAIKMINEIPESKMIFVINMLTGIKGLLVEEVEPDEWDLAMIAEAKKENDGEPISFEEMLKKDGLTYAELQD